MAVRATGIVSPARSTTVDGRTRSINAYGYDRPLSCSIDYLGILLHGDLAFPLTDNQKRCNGILILRLATFELAFLTLIVARSSSASAGRIAAQAGIRTFAINMPRC